MKKSRAIRVAVLVLVTGAMAVGGYALAASGVVTMTSTGPQPAAITVNLGDTLTWTNAGSVPYGIAAGRLGITSPSIPPGGTFSHVFTKSGTFNYQQQAADKHDFNGSIVVTRTGSVTLSPSREAVLYGGQVLLSGVTTLPQFPVTIEQKPAGERSWLAVTSLTPAADGSFSLPVKPTIGTSYRARALESELISDTVPLVVKPVVSIRSTARKLPGGKFVTLTVRIAPGAAARTVEVSQFDRDRLEWKRLATRAVSTAGVATYRFQVPYGRTLLRGWLKRKNLRPGYAESSSANLLIQGTGKPPQPPAKPEKKKRKRDRD